jgi:hypothetical protein
MKFLLICALMAFAHPAVADWYFEASLEGGAEFWTYTNADGNVSPRRVKGNEIWITRTNAVNGLGSDGACSFDNCTITVYINGRLPRGQKLVKVISVLNNGHDLKFVVQSILFCEANHILPPRKIFNFIHFLNTIRKAVNGRDKNMCIRSNSSKHAFFIGEILTHLAQKSVLIFDAISHHFQKSAWLHTIKDRWRLRV